MERVVGDPGRKGINWGPRSGGGVVKPFKRNNAASAGIVRWPFTEGHEYRL